MARLSLQRVDRPRALSDGRRHCAAVTKSEFTRRFKQCRSDGVSIYLDQYGRCYTPASSERLRELDVENDPDVDQLQLRVMFVDNEAGRSSSMMAVSERRMLLIPGDVVELRTVATKRSARVDDKVKEMSVFSVLGHAHSRCFIVYLQDITV
jgi:hypothetical protein